MGGRSGIRPRKQGRGGAGRKETLYEGFVQEASAAGVLSSAGREERHWGAGGFGGPRGRGQRRG